MEMTLPLEWTENAQLIFKDRYAIKNKYGDPSEEPEEIIQRVANWAADDSFEYEQFKHILKNKLFLPNTPTWVNADNPRGGTKSACFTFDIHDDLMDITRNINVKAAKITQQGGGVGFNLSRLRPRGDIVKSSGKIASGVLSWMKWADTMADVISQGGIRRGAVMCLLDVSHPDIFDFIKSKSENEQAYRNMNISVKITHDFMKAVEEDLDWNLVNPRDNRVWKIVKARDLLIIIAKHSAIYGEPGVVFSDTINDFNPTPHLGRMETTNPCAEYPGYDNESCTLGSINLYAHLAPHLRGFDYEKLEKTVRLGVRFLDNVITKNTYAFKSIEEATKRTRKIGLGIMGWATSLMAMRVRYGSDFSIELAEKVMEFINEIARQESRRIAQLKGNYPAFIPKDGESHMRNATRTTIAPTGTISIVANVSGGIEPMFSFVVERPVLGGQRIVDFDPAFIKLCQEYEIPETEVRNAISNGSLRGTKFPEYLKSFMVTASDLSPDDHLRTQIAFQKFTDNAVSKTVNLPKGSTWKDILYIYEQAWKNKLKGVAVYIDGSRDEQILNLPEPEGEWVYPVNPPVRVEPQPESYHLKPDVITLKPLNLVYNMEGLSLVSDISHCTNGKCSV